MIQPSKRSKPLEPSKQLPLPLVAQPLHSLDGFVLGSNGLLMTHVRSLIGSAQTTQTAQTAQNPTGLYLWGESGSGKTHVLRAVANAWPRAQAEEAALPLDAAPAFTVAWFDAQDPLPWAWDNRWRLVVVDNCERLSPAAQHAAFVLFNEALTHGAQFAAAGRLPPTDLPLRDDLRTRLGWGHIFQLQALGEADTRLAVEAEARRRGFAMPAEVLQYLVSRFARDLGSLMSLVDRLDHHALATSRRLTVPLLRDMLAQPQPQPQPQLSSQA